MMEDHGRNNAQAALDNIIEMMQALITARDTGEAVLDGETMDEDAIYEHILEDPLSIEVRTAWHVPGSTDAAREYRILLTTGGPACQIVGDLSEHGEPISASIQYQDWGTPWETLASDTDAPELVDYAYMFYYGE